jgi:hypothetical protein
MVTMQFNFELIFPIRDVPSAELMTLKAACLWNAGVIDARQKKLVEERAQKFLEPKVPQGAGAARTRCDPIVILRDKPARRTIPDAA